MQIKMFFKFTSISTTLLFVVSINAEPPAPYAAAGYRPSRPFNLPRDYLPPVADEFQPQQQQPRQPQYDDVSQQQAYDIEIRKQRVDFVGQIQDNALVHDNQQQQNREPNRPQNAYLPPANDEFLKAQELPHEGRPQQFIQQASPAEQPQRQFGQQPQQNFLPQNVDLPAQEYGAPDLPEPRQLHADVREVNAQQEDNRAAIEALNAAAEAYNRAQLNRQKAAAEDPELATDEGNREDAGYPASKQQRGSRLSQGQYYVLGPDNTVQRVMFTTSQDEQDKRNNGFSANLRYTPVGEARDPVFKYNNKGQLVRLFK